MTRSTRATVAKESAIAKAAKRPRVALYTRVSTEEQAREGFSLANQEERLRAFAVSKDWEIAGVWAEPGESGRTDKRPQYQDLMNRMEEWDVLAVVKMDRIHRNIRNFFRMFDALTKGQREFASVTETLDSSTAMGRFVIGILQGIAQLESEVIGERTTAGMGQKAKGSHILGQRTPYGYSWSKGDARHGTGTWKIDPEKAKDVVRVFELSAAKKPLWRPKEYRGGGQPGTGVKSIAKALGWCSCKPKVSKSTKRLADGTVKVYKSVSIGGNCGGCARVRWIKSNPAYLGFYTWGGTIFKGTHEPIISRKLWEKAEANDKRRLHVVLPPWGDGE